MTNNLQQSIHSECYENNFMDGDFFHIGVSPITHSYLGKLGMNDDEIIELHKAVWDLAFTFSHPTKRKKTSRKEARQIKKELEHKYDIYDYDEPLEGEPETSSYEECIDQVVNRLDSSKRLIICGGLATGKTTLAKRIRRVAKSKSYDIEIWDEYISIGQDNGNHTLQCMPYFPEDEKSDFRIFMSVPNWRQIWNGLKRLPSFHATPGLFTQDIRLRERYELDFQKSISDIVVKYSVGRFVLFDHFVKAKTYDPFDGY